ncbi:MAG TPA: RelA/SpoT family protein [Gammaproteobacteria bacterium]|nr:RelA/SpoT family protein [Gammaproteobacteria bacterium]
MNQFDELCHKLKDYLAEDQIVEIRKAYLVSAKAHEGQQRYSGEPYILHPVAVARILADMHMDKKSIIAAILHDVLEDTAIDKATITEQFGEEVAELVDGVSKLEQINFESRVEAQAENLRKMMLAMARDIRVILIKLADRLHNMRTLGVMPLDKRRRIAKETLEIYSPIANRLGMNNFRIEFEDIGFSFLYPVRYRVLKDAVRKARGNRKELIQDLESNIRNRLTQENVSPFIIMGREKHLYSLYKKMRKKDLSLSEIMDVYAVRILVDKVDDCYRVLGVVHNTYRPVHGRFKDYIAIPKANGYQSLHTTVLGPYGVPIEIQIRTTDMNRMAENGIAAHWLYKSAEGIVGTAEVRAREWLKGILEIQKNTGNSREFIEHVKVDLYPDEVYVFTPGGDILSLPSGATAVDFAYAVHTDVGNACIAAKIDRRLVPLSSRINSGQTIEIITASGAHPNPAWLSFVATGKARSNIRHWLKMQQVSEARILGKRLIERALVSLSLSLEEVCESRIKSALQELDLENFDQLCEEVGLGNQVAPLVVRRLVSDLPVEDSHLIYPLAIRGTEGMVVSYAKCCRPIPGDVIAGFLSAGRGIVVHREGCKNLVEMHKSPEKYIFIQWSDKVIGEFQIELRVEVLSKRGILAILANKLSENEANIQNVHIDERDNRHNTITFLLSIQDRNHLAKLIRQLRQIKIVTRVVRVK